MSDPSNRDHRGSESPRPRWVPLWLFVLILVAIGWAVLWGNNRREEDSPQVTAVQAKAESSTSSQADKDQAVAALQQSLKSAMDQISELQRLVGALAARVDSLERGSQKKRGGPH
jgi:septal ring factor EnvC (AmiA/AmiB activator)